MLSDIFWIDTPRRRRLAIMARPRAGDWLTDEVAGWRNTGVTTVASLLERDEVFDLELREEPILCSRHGIEFLSFPIPDRGVPEMFDARAFANALLSRLHAGGSVAIHCRAGIGRSSLVAGAVLVLDGMAATDALAAIARARGTPVPDTAAQTDWLMAFDAMAAGLR
ncbi:MAG: protein-tyrosine phosphatase family protein [Sphingobium sp.]